MRVSVGQINDRHISTSVPPHRGPSALRLIFGYGVIVAVLPYVVLKVLWIAGNMVGVPASSPAHEGWVAQNAVTLGMDVVAVLIALAFTYSWGTRVPAWLIVVPVWVATGFLVPASLEVAVGFLRNLLVSGQLINMPGGLVEPWAYIVVYLSFAGQGVCLTGAFVYYARDRWAGAFDGASLRRPPTPGPIRSVLVALIGAGSAMAFLVGALRLFQALWAPVTWRSEPWTVTVRMVEGVEGGFAVLSGLALLAMVGVEPFRRLVARVPGWSTLAFAWVGSGAMFAYGLLRTFSILAGAQLSELFTAQSRLINFTALLAGLVLSLAGAFLLAQRRQDERRPEASGPG